MTTQHMADKAVSDRTEGAGSAAVIAAGMGCLMVGILTTAAEMSASFKETLDLYSPVGPLSGKTIFATVVWAVVWAILHFTMKDKDFAISKAMTIALALFGLAALLTFPTFFQLFAAE